MNSFYLRWRYAAASLLFAVTLGWGSSLSAQCTVDGGGIALADGALQTTIVVDGTPDPLSVTRDGTASGPNAAWVITDADGLILGLPPAPPFDLDGAGVGTCLIWYLRFEPGLTGAAVGQNAADLQGCFDLSNPLTVNRVAPGTASGGGIAFADGSTATSICVDDAPDPLAVTRDGTASGANAIWVITDADLNVLGLPQAPPFDLNGAGRGTCLIWYMRYNGIVRNVFVGANVSAFDGDFALSNALTVERNQPEAGVLAFADGSSEKTITVDDTPDPLATTLSGERFGSARGYVITDAEGNILGLPMAPPFDLNGAGVGVCQIWYLRWEPGLQGRAVGNNLSDLRGCFDLSNPITVDRVAPGTKAVTTGLISMPSGATTRYVCPGNDGPITVQLNYATPAGQVAYAITDEDFNILKVSTTNGIDLSGAGVGRCYIWAFNYTGTITATAGESVFSTKFSTDEWLISQNAILAIRERPAGGTVATPQGETTVYTCVDGTADFVGFSVSGQSAANSVFVITDADNIILGLNTRGFADFDGAGVGDCRVWHLSYTGSLTAKPGDDAAAVALSDRCFDLSDNFITVVRNTPEGGQVSGNGQAIVRLEGSDRTVDFSTTSTSTAAYSYFVLNPDFSIRAIVEGAYDFTGAPTGQYLVYGASYTGDLLPVVGGPLFGQRVSVGCFDLSDGAVSVMVRAGLGFTAAPVAPRTIRLALDEPSAVETLGAPSTVSVTDAYGRILLEQDLASPAALDGLLLDLGRSSTGLHLVTVRTGEDVTTKKVMLSLP